MLLLSHFSVCWVFLFQEDKELGSGEPVSARAQLVAEAVVAFTKNNSSRDAVGLPRLENVGHFLTLVLLRSCHDYSGRHSTRYRTF